jgi:hypothetical protein
MNEALVFLVGLAATMGVVLVALLYLKNPLQNILADLCGTTERARFWTAFSNITLFLVPLALALGHQPDASVKQAAIFEISGQMECAAIGFVVSIVVMGFILSTYISRGCSVRPAKGNDVR